MNRTFIRRRSTLVIGHIALAFFAGLILPRILPLPRFGNLSGQPILFVTFAQMTLLCFYFVFGRRENLPIRSLAVFVSSVFLGALLATAERGSIPLFQLGPTGVRRLWLYYRLTLVPIPCAGFAAALISISGRQLLPCAPNAQLSYQFRSMHLFLLTLLAAVLLVIQPWQAQIVERYFDSLEEMWQRHGDENFLKLQLTFWSLLCGVSGYCLFVSVLSHSDAASTVLVIVLCNVAVSALASIIYVHVGIRLWSNFIGGALTISFLLAISFSAVKRSGFQLVRRS